ncbi:MAG: MogA/MoaB family molybdenum cofactor biosynthesis protein [Limnochordaceae bacterium]|nr:MogA/MoaB family molybdenum cofactor biosynthesis protein [Limnochordaceae bacterium]
MHPVRAAVITVSDGVAAGRREDASGRRLVELLTGRVGAEVVWTAVVPDEKERIAAAIVEACDRRQADLVLTTGGTGMAPRDVTPEATAAVLDRMAPGIAEAVRWYGLQKTRAAMLSRGVAGIRGRSLVINLPGSPDGAGESLEAIADQLAHAVGLLRGEITLHEPSHRHEP